jgi:DhnA family fructose-bisphosphate aldolase class Ia
MPMQRPLPTLADLGIGKRLSRLFDPQSGNAIIIAIDHGIFSGAVPGLEDLAKVARACAEGGADAIQVGPGGARAIAQVMIDAPRLSLVLRLDNTTAYRHPRPKRICSGLLASIEDAAQAGADVAVINYLDLTDDPEEERDNLVRAAQAAAAARRAGMPIMIEPLAMGGPGESVTEPATVARIARMAAELGADVLKVDYPGSDDGVRRLVGSVPVPVLIRGGPKTDDPSALLRAVERAVSLGVRGVVFGRNAWQVPDVGAAMRDLVRAVHGR